MVSKKMLIIMTKSEGFEKIWCAVFLSFIAPKIFIK